MILGKTVEELRRGMPHAELLEWICFFEEAHPIPDPARDAAQICAVTANAHREKGARAFRVQEFLARPPGKGKGQDVEQMRAIFDRFSGGS